MVDYLERWREERRALRSVTLPASLDLIGRYKGVPGRYEPAAVRFTVTPAERFQVVDLVPIDRELRATKYAEFFSLGLLDVLMAENPDLPHRLCITLKSVECDKQMVPPLSFRLAGRDGGLYLCFQLRHL